MGLVKRGGKFLTKDGKLVTTENCCCNCFEYCSDTEIAVTLPAFTTAAGCDNCEDVDAGPWVLTKYTPAEPVAGCCYWKNEEGGGTGECAVVSIEATACISGEYPDEVVTLTITVNSAGGVIHTFTQEYSACDFCDLIPGAVDVDAGGGECNTEGVASILFAGGCCLGPYCDCECYGGADTPDTYTLNMTVFPACVAAFDSPITLNLSIDRTYYDGYAIDENDNEVVIRLTCEHGYFTPENTSPPSSVPCDNQPACRYLLSFTVIRLIWNEELEAYLEGLCEWHGYLCDPGSFPWVFSGTTNRETQCPGGCDDDWEAEVTE